MLARRGKRRPAGIPQINFGKSIKRSSRYTHKRQAVFFCPVRGAYPRTRRVKKKELSIKGRSFLLCKKCLNVICVRVWPGYDETGGRWKQSSGTEGKKRGRRRQKGRRRRHTGVNFSGKKSSLMDSLSRPSPANDSFPKSYPRPLPPPRPRSAHVYVHARIGLSPLLLHEGVPSKPSWTTEST